MTTSSQRDLFSDQTARIGSQIVLQIKGIIPGKKNNKMLVTRDPRGRPLRRPFLITKPEYQEALAKITVSLQSQLRSACQTACGETLTESLLRYWIASSLPADDSWTHVPEMTIRGELCEPGHEGATVTITRIK